MKRSLVKHRHALLQDYTTNQWQLLYVVAVFALYKRIERFCIVTEFHQRTHITYRNLAGGGYPLLHKLS